MKGIFSLFFFVFAAILCYAQVLTNDNVTITVTSGAQVTVKGDVQNQNAGTITNNGTIDLSGNWINNAANDCFGTSQGTVVLNGSSQTIGGSNSTTFNNLTLLGTSTKTLLINTTAGGGVSPAGVVSLNDRELILNSNTLTITNPSPTAITRTSGFIESETDAVSGYGILKWNIGNTSAGNNYDFPFGNTLSGSYLPVSFNITTAGIGSSGSVSISTYPTVTSANPNNRPLPTGITQFINAFTGNENAPNVADRFWVFDVQNYTVQPTTTLTFSYRDSEWDATAGSTNTISEFELQAQRYNGTQWFAPVGTVNTTQNTVSSLGISNYNSVWILVRSNEPVPIELLKFEANLNKNKQVLCSWATATEINNDYFTIERSIDGRVFEVIGKVEGAGNSSSIINYSFLDKNPHSNLSYYRLRQTDFDGQYSYSEIVSVNISDEAFVVYPNPATDEVTIILNEIGQENHLINIFDAAGNIVGRYPVSGDILRIQTSSWSKGIYLLQLISNRSVHQQKLLIK
jgi:hypothetical protein